MRALIGLAILCPCLAFPVGEAAAEAAKPKIVFLIGEREYSTAETLPAFAREHLDASYRTQFIHASDADKNRFDGIVEALEDADLLFVSVRRRTPPVEQMRAIEAFIKAGKPVVGIRTASHAFSLRGKAPPEGHRSWERFDPEVFGGNYHGHHGNKLKTSARVVALKHPATVGVGDAEFPTGGSLYEVLPLEKGAVVLLDGKAEGVAERQPVAWTFSNAFGGRSFYTSLGHVDDFGRSEFTRLLKNAVEWAVAAPDRKGASSLRVPGLWEEQAGGRWAELDGEAWYAARVRVPDDWGRERVALEIESVDNAAEVWFAGERIGGTGSFPPEYRNGIGERASLPVPPRLVLAGEEAEVAIRVFDAGGRGGFKARAPVLSWKAELSVVMAGEWRFEPGAAAPSTEGLPAFVAVTRTTRSAHETVAGALSPEESLQRIEVPDDLEVDLLLSEPLIKQPLHLSFDRRGRLWVVQYMQYPEPAGIKQLSRDKVWRVAYDRMPPPPPHPVSSRFRGRDRISIHEDTDGDGKYDLHKVFADGLNMATSVAHGEGGVWVTNPPYLLFYPDSDGDDVPDGPPEVRLKGFGLEDTHSIANSLMFGPDGWLYGAQGSTVSASITRPGIDAPEDAIKSMGQNIWRYHPGERRYEIYAEGGGNAFGVEIDSRGRIFSGHNGGDTRGFHYVQGGYYRKSWGKHGALTNPYAYGFFPAMRNAKVARFTHQFIVYEDGGLPERYRDKLWGVDVLHNNIVLAELTPDGSTFQTRDIERVVRSSDPWFRPVMVTAAPDGSVLIADWYDQQVNHYRNHEGRIDREMGRVYRVRRKGERADARAIPKDRWPELRVATRKADFDSEDAAVRRWSVREHGAEIPEGFAAREKDLEVLSQLACTAKRIDPAAGLAIATELARRDELASDPHLPLLVWWAIEARCANEAEQVVTAFEDSTLWGARIVRETVLPRLLRRWIEGGGGDGLDRCGELLALAPDEDARLLVASAIAEHSASAAAQLPEETLAVLRRLGGRLPLGLQLRIGHPGAAAEALRRIRDRKASADERAALLAIAADLRVDGIEQLLAAALAADEAEAVQLAGIAALAGWGGDPRMWGLAFDLVNSSRPAVTDAALGLLASGKESAIELLRRIDEGEVKVDREELAFAETLRAHGDPAIDAAVERIWGAGRGSVDEAQERQIAELREVLADGEGVPKRGERVYAARCGGCHVLYGKGGAIGPELTSYQRGDEESLLLSIIAPGAEIREGYENTLVRLKSGAVHSGFRVEEDERRIVLRELSGLTRTLNKGEVESVTPSAVSLMPPGLLSGLGEGELRDLFAYLRTTTPPF